MRTYLPPDLLALAQRTGRWTLKQLAGSPVLYTTNLGSTLRFVINNSEKVTITVGDHHANHYPSHRFAIRVDKGPWHRYPASQRNITVHLSPTQHLVEVMTAGNTDFDNVWTGDEGFTLSGVGIGDRGQLKPAPHRPVIDFIGDSITAGCWVNGKHAAVDYRPESNYAALCCDQLGVDSVRIAYSAGGVLRPATGGVPVAKDFLPRIDADTPWTPNTPDLVVVNLGVNDRRYPLPAFTHAYDDFLSKVTTTFPTAPVAVMVPFSQTLAPTISQLAAKHLAHLIPTAGWCTSYTDGLHPDQVGARQAAVHLTRELGPLLTR